MELEDFTYFFSLSASTVRFTFIFLLLLFFHKPAEGQFRLIGSPQPIVAAPGDDVVLPCHVEPAIDVARLTIEWSNPDLQPDPNDRLSRVKYVHLYWDSHEDTAMKLSSYVRRTALFTDGLHRGNISLKITNVTFADEGRYRCFLPKLKSQQKFSIVSLIIEPNSAETLITEAPLPTTVNQTLQIPESEEDDDEKGGLYNQSRLLLVFCILPVIIVGVIVTLKLLKVCPKQEPGETTI